MVSRAHESLCYVGERARSRAALSADFYVRRARRLFPALAVVLAACLLLGWFVLLPAELQSLGRHIGAAAAFILNFAVWHEGSYFDPVATLNPVLHLWSLGIEEQFYLDWVPARGPGDPKVED
jgi:peptidoglycan/LPS O-acetylase OafA/YrhL